MPVAQRLWTPASEAFAATVQLVLPPVCRLCGDPVEETEDFCRQCSTGLAISEPAMKSACPRCGIPKPQVVTASRNTPSASPETLSDLDPGDGVHTSNGPTVEQASGIPDRGAETQVPQEDACGDRSATRTCRHCCDLDLLFDGVITLWAYRGLVCDAVVAAKFAHQAPLGDAMGRKLGEAVKTGWTENGPTS